MKYCMQWWTGNNRIYNVHSQYSLKDAEWTIMQGGRLRARKHLSELFLNQGCRSTNDKVNALYALTLERKSQADMQSDK